MQRLEYKYLVPVTAIDSIRREIKPFVDLDSYAQQHENGTYTVRSIYMDTLDFECYRTKIDGIDIRKKYRIRGYNSATKNNIVFLEIKRKYFDRNTKNRAPLNYENLKPFFATGKIDDYILAFSHNGTEKADAQKYLYHYFRKGLRPVVLIIYDREAFVGKFDKTLRLTFDKSLRSRIFPTLDMLFNDFQLKYSMTEFFIFEVKIDSHLPVWLKSILERHALKRQSLSKYAICLDSHFQMQLFLKNSGFHRQSIHSV